MCMHGVPFTADMAGWNSKLLGWRLETPETERLQLGQVGQRSQRAVSSNHDMSPQQTAVQLQLSWFAPRHLRLSPGSHCCTAMQSTCCTEHHRGVCVCTPCFSSFFACFCIWLSNIEYITLYNCVTVCKGFLMSPVFLPCPCVDIVSTLQPGRSSTSLGTGTEKPQRSETFRRAGCAVVQRCAYGCDPSKFWNILKRRSGSQNLSDCGTLWNWFPLSLGQQSLSTRLQETTIPTNTIQTIRYRCSPIERLLMIIMFATTTDGLQHFSAPSAYYYHSHTHTSAEFCSHCTFHVWHGVAVADMSKYRFG